VDDASKTAAPRQAWLWFLLPGLAAALLHPLVEPALRSDIAYFAIALYGTTGVLLGIKSNRPVDRTPWLFFAAAMLLLWCAELMHAIADITPYFARHINLADVLYLATYALFFVALLGLVRGREGVPPRSGLLDSLIVIAGLMLLGWQFLLLPTYTASPGYGPPQMLRVFYPIADLVLIGMLVWLRTAPEVRSPAFNLLLVGTLLWTLADCLFHLTSMSSSEPHALLKSTWLVAHVMWGAAVMHPSMHALQAARDAEHTDISSGRIAVLLAGVLCIPGSIALQLLFGVPLNVMGAVYGGVAIILLVWLRVRILMRRIHESAEHMKVLSQTDFLTGLPNRRHLAQRAQVAVGTGQGGIALLSIDLDRFKGVNDTFGHHVGDEMLRATAIRLQAGMREGDLVARTGGDEFICLLHPPVSRSIAQARAQELHLLLKAPMELQGLHLNVAASIGVAVSPGDGTDFEGLLKSANWAMRAAKRRQSRVEMHTSRLDDNDSWRLLLLNEFRDAMRRSELVVHYQPKVHFASRRVVGVEALVRWQHPQHGLLQPDAFLPAVEQTELIRDMTEYVLHQAVGQCTAWRADGLALSVAVNLSTRSIPDLELVGSIKRCLKKFEFPAEALELEITESSAMADPAHGLKTLHTLEKLGVLLSVDDYGMGYGSLDYLRKLPVKVLKLDRSFISRMHASHADAAIVRSTLELARHLHMDVVAEGVEDAGCFEALGELGCYAAQGYYLSRPVAAGQLKAVITEIESRLGPARQGGVALRHTAGLASTPIQS